MRNFIVTVISRDVGDDVEYENLAHHQSSLQSQFTPTNQTPSKPEP